jgi:hypothetical protein
LAIKANPFLQVNAHDIIVHIVAIAYMKISLSKDLQTKMLIEAYGRVVSVHIQLYSCLVSSFTAADM